MNNSPQCYPTPHRGLFPDSLIFLLSRLFKSHRNQAHTWRVINLFKPEGSSPQPFSCTMFRGGPGPFASCRRLRSVAALGWGTPHSQPAGNPTAPPGAAGEMADDLPKKWHIQVGPGTSRRRGRGRGRRRAGPYLLTVCGMDGGGCQTRSPQLTRPFPGPYLPRPRTSQGPPILPVREVGRKPESLSSVRCFDLPPPIRWTPNSPRPIRLCGAGSAMHSATVGRPDAMILKGIQALPSSEPLHLLFPLNQSSAPPRHTLIFHGAEKVEAQSSSS